MELFNLGDGAESTEKQTYRVIKDRIGISEEEFMSLSIDERNEWVDACRLALLLQETNSEKMYDGYKDTDMYSENKTFNLGAATEIVRNKKRTLIVIEKQTDIDLTPAQFILMGDVESRDLVNEMLKQINLDTVNTLSESRIDDR